MNSNQFMSDMSQKHTAFQLRIFELVRSVPPGFVTTYGAVAKHAGSAGSARAVGQTMKNNPYSPDSGCALEQIVP